MSSFPFIPRTISLVDRHSGIHQGTRRCRCSYSTGTVTAGNVQIERSRCTETSADAEHLYLITYTPECRLPAPHPDHQRGSGTQRGIVHRHVLDDHAFDVQQSFELALQLRRFLRLYFLVEKQTYRKRPSHIGIQRLTDEPPPTKTTQAPKTVHITPSNRQKKHQPRQPNHLGHPNHNPHPSNSSHQPAPPTQRQPLPAIPQPAPQSPSSAPSWDVPSADSSATFPDVL